MTPPADHPAVAPPRIGVLLINLGTPNAPEPGAVRLYLKEFLSDPRVIELVTAQVALSFLLLFGAGLFVRSLQNLRTTDTGFELDNLVTFQLSPALNGYTDERGTQFYRDLRLHSIGGGADEVMLKIIAKMAAKS